MKCRALVKNDLTKKQNIVWFGSYGKNENYVPQSFGSFGADHKPIVNGKPWDSVYTNYYILTEGPFLNMSPNWGEFPIWPSETLFPADDLYPNTGEAALYFKLDESTGVLIPVLSMPADWKENYGSYYIARFAQNSSSDYDPATVYYAFGNKLSADNYSEGAKGVRDSLIQRLSVIKGELWYKSSYGLPLTEKIKNKGIYDSIVVNIITSHPDVANLISFDSRISAADRRYEVDFTAMSVFNEEFAIRYTI